MPPIRLAVTAVLCAVLAACTGGSRGGRASGSPSPTGMSHADYVSAANAVCKDVGDKAEALREPTTAVGYAETLAELLAILEDGQRRLEALTPPAADRAAVEDNFIEVGEDQVTVLREALPKVRAAADAGDQRKAQEEFVLAFQTISQMEARDESWTTSYGLTECA